MKKSLLIIVTIIAVSLGAEWVDVSANSQLFDHNSTRNNLTNVNFTLDGYELETIEENGEIYQKISYWNEGQFIEEGKPDLPRFTRLIAIPDAGEVSVEIIDYDTQILQNMNIYPSQKLQIESEPIRNEFVIDTQFYAGNEIFPQKIVEIGEPAIMRNYRVVAVTINPFQYNPATKELRIISNIEVAVETSGRGGKNIKTRNLKKSRSFEKLYESTILNYDSVQNRDDEYQNPSILFIYRNNANVETYIEYLADWKHQKGFEVKLASTSVTGTSTTSIKNYIQNAYNTWENPPEYIVLAGDAGGDEFSIPTYFENWSGYTGPGDHPYTQLEGGDILADAYIGRLSFESYIQLDTIIDKILYYEKEPYLAQTNWYNKSVMVGDPSTSGPSCVHTKRYIKEMMDVYAPNINTTEVYSESYSSAMSTNINNGVSYFNYRGWLGMSDFDNTDINNLNNGLMLPFAVFLTCGTGTFSSEVSRSEAFIRAGSSANQKGAIGAIGTATLGTHTTFNNCVDTGIFYGVFVDQLYTPGAALLRGKLHLYETFPQNPSNKVDIFSYWNNLMGDPSVELWTAEPKPLTVNYESNIALGSNYIEIEVLDNGGLPVENAWVSILKGDDEFFEIAFTDENGKVTLPIDAHLAGSFFVTVTKHNFIPHLGSANIVSELNAISVYATQINDDNSGSSSGNNDGHINPGETIELRVALMNYGSQTANSVTATISSENDFVTITDNSEIFGTISAGNSVFSSDDFDFSINSDVLDDSEIRLNIHIEDGSGNEYEDVIFLHVDGIKLYVSDYDITSGDGIFNPGETVNMTVELFNTGAIDAESIEATLSCANENITINDNYGIYTTIYSGNSTSNNLNRFEVTASNDIIKGSQIPFELTLSNSNGFNSTISFIVEVGTVTVYDPLGPDNYGYYCYDSGDTAYDLAPVYSWIEISTSGTNLNLNDNGDTGDVADVNVPFNFGFYGVQYNSISVCSNGWIAVGESDNETFMNSPIPGPQGPSPMIAPFWDDLAMSSGDVYYKYDSAEHIFIIEWYDVITDQYNSNEKFEVIIYDPDYYPTPSGDAEIVFQYADVNNTSAGSYSGYSVQHGQYSTVGLEDHTGTVGLQYTFNNSYPTAAKPLQDGLAIKFTTIGSSVLEPPIAQFSDSNFNFSVLPDETDSDVLQISNSGEANLIYSISKDYQDEVVFNRDSGGPDNYGYMWFDSNEPGGPTYNWIDISGTGTQVNFSTNDDGTSLIPIGFDFDYYGVDYSQFRINPNGWVGFGNDDNEWNNMSIPSSGAPKPAIFGFWDDLNPENNSPNGVPGGNVYYHSNAERLVVWFDDVVEWNSSTPNGTYDFQMVIYANGEILFQYRSVSGTTNSVTIGIQNANGNDGLQVAYNQNYVENNLAVIFKKVNDWLTISSSSGVIEAGGSDNISIAVDATDLELGEYGCDMIVTTNDPTQTTVIIPIIFTVANQAQLDPPTNVQIVVEPHATVPGRVVRTLNWSAVVGATSYNVYASSNPFSEDWGTPINESPITGTTFVSEGSSLMKYYRVTAVN